MNHPKLKNEYELLYVVPHSSWVVTRYLFVFNTTGANRKGQGKGRYFEMDATLRKNYRAFLESRKEKERV